jgi:hypothetical protein
MEVGIFARGQKLLHSLGAKHADVCAGGSRRFRCDCGVKGDDLPADRMLEDFPEESMMVENGP